MTVTKYSMKCDMCDSVYPEGEKGSYERLVWIMKHTQTVGWKIYRGDGGKDVKCLCPECVKNIPQSTDCDGISN